MYKNTIEFNEHLDKMIKKLESETKNNKNENILKEINLLEGFIANNTNKEKVKKYIKLRDDLIKSLRE